MNDIKVTVLNKLYVSSLSPALERAVVKDLTLQMGFATFNTGETLTLAERIDGALVVPRGYFNALLRRIKEAGGVPVIDDRRLKLPPIDLEFHGELRSYQRKALEVMSKYGSGVLVGGCGSGKTVMGCALIAHWRQPALVLVHTKDLVRQWKGELRNFLDTEAGQIGDGVFDVQPVTVALVQSLVARPGLLEDIRNQFGLTLLDECAHAPATTFTATLQQFPAALRYGLSATPERADGLTPFLYAVIGPKRHEITSENLRADGVLVTPEIYMTPTEFTSYQVEDWAKLMSELVENEERNNLATDIIVNLIDDGRRIIALSERVAHVEKLAEMVNQLRPGAAVMAHGKLPKETRIAALEKIRGDARVLLATKLADEGLDLPILDAVVLLTPSRDAGRTTQRVGRTLRAIPGKPAPVVIDLVDVNVSVLANQARTRFFDCYRHLAPGSRLPEWLETRRRAA